MSQIWITRRKGKTGIRYLVRWIEPMSGANRGKTFYRLEDAREFQSKLRNEIRNHEYHIPVKIGYDRWVEDHLDSLRNSPENDLAEKTIIGHMEALRALGDVCKPKSPIEINPPMIRVFRQSMLDREYHPRTVNKHISAIRSALSYAVRDQIVPSNKLIGPHRLFLRYDRKPIRTLEVGEVVALMNLATDMRYKTAISLAYYHGLRKGEFCYLQWQDIDFEQQRLNVVDRPENHTKKRESRSIPLRVETVKLLEQLKAQRVNQYVFEHPKRFYWHCGPWFKKLVKDAGLDYCTLHDLRKICNTLMKRAGVSIEVVMQILGHSTPDVNRKHYTGPLTSQAKKAIDVIPTVG